MGVGLNGLNAGKYWNVITATAVPAALSCRSSLMASLVSSLCSGLGFADFCLPVCGRDLPILCLRLCLGSGAAVWRSTIRGHGVQTPCQCQVVAPNAPRLAHGCPCFYFQGRGPGRSVGLLWRPHRHRYAGTLPVATTPLSRSSHLHRPKKYNRDDAATPDLAVAISRRIPSDHVTMPHW
jgi:hypothetical protein